MYSGGALLKSTPTKHKETQEIDHSLQNIVCSENYTDLNILFTLGFCFKYLDA